MNTRLRYLREGKNLTQKDVSEKIDISRERYNQYETGKRKPDYETLSIIADFFDVSTDYLLCRTDSYNLTTVITPSAPSLSENQLELLELFNRISDERQQIKLLGKFEVLIENVKNDFQHEDAEYTVSKKDVGWNKRENIIISEKMPSKYRKTLKISHDINDKSIIVKNFCGSTKKEVQVYIYKYKLELLFLITFQDEN